MDDDRISISLAATAIKLPQPIQREVSKTAKAGDLRAVKKVVKQEIRAKHERELGAKIRALPDKKFGVILADPEWRFETWSDAGQNKNAAVHYATSTTEVIASRDVPKIAFDDCVLFLWSPDAMIEQALGVMRTWAEYRARSRGGRQGRRHRPERARGPGHDYWYWIRPRPCRRRQGEPPAPAMAQSKPDMAPRTTHSAKPEKFFEMIESYFPSMPKIELNRRGPPRDGWKAWGAEAEVEEVEDD